MTFISILTTMFIMAIKAVGWGIAAVLFSLAVITCQDKLVKWWRQR